MFSDNFDATSWMMVSLVGINASAFSIFIFEWLSPAGHDRKVVRFTYFKYGFKCELLLQGRENRYVCFAKQQPGRAR